MRKFILAALIAVVALGFSTPSADAAFKIRARTNIDGFVTATDQVFVGGVGTVADGSPVAGVIVASFTFPGVTFLVTVGASKPAVGSAAEAKLDISIDGSFSATPLGRTQVVVEVTDTGYGAGFGPSGLGILTSELGGAGFGDLTSFSFQSWLDDSNAEFGIPGVPAFGTPILTAPGTSSAGGSASSPYSLSSRTIINGPGGADFSFDNITSFVVPVPPALVLLASGLPVLALLRRRNKKVAA